MAEGKEETEIERGTGDLGEKQSKKGRGGSEKFWECMRESERGLRRRV